MNETLQRDFHIEIDAEEIIKNSIKKEEAREKFIEKIFIEYKKNISSVEKDIYQDLIKEVFINIVDKSWIEHIQAMDHLRQGIGLRSYAQKNPKQEYKREAFEMFSIMQDSMHYNFISLLYRIDYNTTFSKKEKTENLNYNRSDADKKSNTKNNKNKDKRNRKQRKKKRK